MIQDTGNAWIDTDFKDVKPNDTDYVLLFTKGEVYLTVDTRELITFANWKLNGGGEDGLVHVFSIENTEFFIAFDTPEMVKARFYNTNVRSLRVIEPSWLRLAAVTGLHLYQWFSSNKHCSICGAPMKADNRELAVRCTDEHCKAVFYPSIFPAVIVAVRNNGKILLTYSAVYANPVYALVSGYMSVGETFEETAKREVKEETGLDIKNIQYYGNQPWGFSGAQMIGFWADLDGSDQVTVQKSELKEAKWYSPEEIPPILEKDPLDLTHYMIELFRNGKDPK